jgi:hypothetical protein
VSSDLVGGLNTAAQVVSTFETRIDNNITLDFGNGDQIIFESDITSVELINALYIF